MKRKLLAIAGLVAVLAACDYTVDEGAPTPIACCTPLDTLNVRMSGDGNPAERCDQLGGRFDGDICWRVDF